MRGEKHVFKGEDPLICYSEDMVVHQARSRRGPWKEALGDVPNKVMLEVLAAARVSGHGS